MAAWCPLCTHVWQPWTCPSCPCFPGQQGLDLAVAESRQCPTRAAFPLAVPGTGLSLPGAALGRGALEHSPCRAPQGSSGVRGGEQGTGARHGQQIGVTEPGVTQEGRSLLESRDAAGCCWEACTVPTALPQPTSPPSPQFLLSLLRVGGVGVGQCWGLGGKKQTEPQGLVPGTGGGGQARPRWAPM